MEFYVNEDTAWLRRIVRWAVNVVVVLALAWFLVYAFCAQVPVSGNSMQPVLSADDVVLVNRLVYDVGEPERKTPESVSSFCREFVIWFPAPKTSAPEAFETRFATPTILLAIPETTDWEFRDSLLFSEPRIVAPNPWKLCFYR